MSVTMFTTDEMRIQPNARSLDERHYGDILPNLRYYHAPSEPFANGDTLQTFLYRGWKPDEEVKRDVYWLSALRSVSVYVFNLRRGGEEVRLPVQVNPFVLRFVRDMRLHLVAQQDHEDWPTGSNKP